MFFRHFSTLFLFIPRVLADLTVATKNAGLLGLIRARMTSAEEKPNFDVVAIVDGGSESRFAAADSPRWRTVVRGITFKM